MAKQLFDNIVVILSFNVLQIFAQSSLKDVEAAEQRFSAARLKGDKAEWAALLHDDFRWMTAEGESRTSKRTLPLLCLTHPRSGKMHTSAFMGTRRFIPIFRIVKLPGHSDAQSHYSSVVEAG